jgi:anti-anti-sigma factor
MMTFDMEDAGAAVVVRLAGRLDTGGVGEVELAFTARVVPEQRPVLVDLAALEFIASLGVRMLITTARSRARQNRMLALYGATPAVADIIATMGLDEIIPVYPDRAAAAAAVAG